MDKVRHAHWNAASSDLVSYDCQHVVNLLTQQYTQRQKNTISVEKLKLFYLGSLISLFCFSFFFTVLVVFTYAMLKIHDAM